MCIKYKLNFALNQIPRQKKEEINRKKKNRTSRWSKNRQIRVGNIL